MGSCANYVGFRREDHIVLPTIVSYSILFYLDGPGERQDLHIQLFITELHNRGYKFATAAWTGIAAI